MVFQRACVPRMNTTGLFWYSRSRAQTICPCAVVTLLIRIAGPQHGRARHQNEVPRGCYGTQKERELIGNYELRQLRCESSQDVRRK